MIFGSSPDHRRTSDINVFDRLIPGDIRSGHRFPERVQIHHHQINGGDALLLQISLMGSITSFGKDAAVHPRMQGLHSTAENLRCAGVLGHTGHRKSGIFQNLGGPTAGQKRITMGAMQRLRQRHNAVFVGHAQQRKRSHGFVTTGS